MARDQVVRRKGVNSAGPGQARRHLNEIAGLVFFGLGVVFLLALISYDAHDPSWNATGPALKARNWIGPVGALLADSLYQACGYAAFILPFAFFALAWWRLIDPRPKFSSLRVLGLGLLGFSLTGLLALAESCAPGGSFESAFHLGGWVGHVLVCDATYGLTRFLNTTGAAIVLAVVFVSGLILATPFTLVGLFIRLTPREQEAGIVRTLSERFRVWRQMRNAERERRVVDQEKERHEQKAKVDPGEAIPGPSQIAPRPVIQVGTPEPRPEAQSEPRLEPRKIERRDEPGENGKVDHKIGLTRPGLSELLGIKKPPTAPIPVVKTPAQANSPDDTGVKPAIKSQPPGAVPAKPPLGLKEREAAASAYETPLTPAAADLSTPAEQNASTEAAASPAAPPSRPLAGRISSHLERFRNRAQPPAEPADTPRENAGKDAAPPPEPIRATAPLDRRRAVGAGEGRQGSSDWVSGVPVSRTAPEVGPRTEAKPGSLIKHLLRPTPEHRLPTTEMLTAPDPRSELADTELMERARQLADKCREFNVAGIVKQISPGPVVTTFEFKLDPGVKYGRVTSLVDDLCLGLKAESIRIDRIPGKSTVGIEIPNHKREIIRLREVLESQRFRDSQSRLSLALGKTIDGSNYVADLAKMPHLLIAGATGAGKSVSLNTILISLLFKSSPDEVKLILIDPKRLELGLYADIPHLLTPIVTDPKRASFALRWAVAEMENRYKHLAAFGVRNIDQYNQEVCPTVDRNLAEDSEDLPRQLPYIVIVIDELADLMMVSARDVEESIIRLAQMARAVGIHLVLATQRPSTDVITGLIKANFPSRIAFRVSSKVDSRVIIDTNGAEGLLGQGDMLFLPPGTSRLIRVHGAYVDEKEVKRIADFIRTQRKPAYDEKIQMSDKEIEGEELTELRKDEKYEEALRIVFEMGRASTSVLQRRLRIGYGRAASIIDMMHRERIVGPEDGSKPRQVLIPAEERAAFIERLDDIREDER